MMSAMPSSSSSSEGRRGSLNFRPKSPLAKKSDETSIYNVGEPDFLRVAIPFKISEATFETSYKNMIPILKFLMENRHDWMMAKLGRAWELMKVFTSACKNDVDVASLWNSRLATNGFPLIFQLFIQDFFQKDILSAKKLNTPNLTTVPISMKNFQRACSTLWNASDNNTVMCEKAWDLGIPVALMKALKTHPALSPNQMVLQDTNPSIETDYYYKTCGTRLVRIFLSIIMNCLRRCPERSNEIRSIDDVETVLGYRNSCHEQIRAIAMCLVAYSASEDQLKELNETKEVIGFLLSHLQGCLDASNRRFNGFSVEEVLDALSRLASNVDVQETLVQSEPLRILALVLRDPKEPLELYRISRLFWTLSFQRDIADRMCGGVSDLKDLLTRHKSSADKEVSKAIAGCFWNLYQQAPTVDSATPVIPTVEMYKDLPQKIAPSKDVIAKAPRKKEKPAARGPARSEAPSDNVRSEGEVEAKEEEKKSKPSHVMLSYDWGQQETIVELNRALRRVGLRTWLDLEEMSGSTLEAMARAVEESSAVIVCVSERYKESPNCRAEAEYAFRLRKPILPLRMTPGFRPNGWLGIILGSKLYFDCHSPAQAAKTASKLASELERIIRSDETFAQIGGSKSAQISSLTSCTGWDSGKTSLWFASKSLSRLSKPDNFGQEFDGEDLAELARLEKENPVIFLRLLDKSGISKPKDIIRLTRALQTLKLG